MNNLFRRFFLALSFLTTLPFPSLITKQETKVWEDIDADLPKSSTFFPLIGFLLGAILFIFNKFLEYTDILPQLSAGLTLVLWVLLSGGLHLEGLADMVDGFSGGTNKDEILRIMKDGSVGAKGAISLILTLLLKYLLLYSLTGDIKGKALLLSPVLGRWAMVLMGYFGKPASSNNTLTRMFVQYLEKKELLIATFFAVCPVLFILPVRFIPPGSLLWFIIGVLVAFLLVFSNKKIGGICGDIIGAANELTELIVLFFFLLILV